MFIQTLPHEDDARMKFLPGRQVLASGSIVFEDEKDGRARSPLAARLFDIPGVSSVELGEDYVTIVKMPDEEQKTLWIQLKPMVLAAIMDHYMSGMPVLIGEEKAASASYSEKDQKIVDAIVDLVETRVRPQLLDDGGDVAFKSYDPADGVVVLEMDSSGLSTPAFGTQIKIENTVKHFIPEIQRVRFERMVDEEAENTTDRPGLQSDEAEQIRVLLETRINPAIAAHGGYITLIDIQDQTAYVEMAGGCQGCGMADATLKQGVEVEIKTAVPMIERVLDVTDHAGGTNPYYVGY
ncbi:NifU family protein [uncultured Sneathiella sp.]|jgi:Fe-S cluster biogenesis protein NfuA|uniref:NifU family protein n=1 Tax=uncultured Sneathiella sp. TaxID=879315 RepID=UPI0030D9C709|tara:strand:- start:3205 stop:4089 length:885 start_codon:yes stop_codon:yes gene_type:complete